MKQYYNKNYTTEQIDEILRKIKNCVIDDKFKIPIKEKRKENSEFIDEYNIRYDKQKSILLDINTDDFCYSLKNTHTGYENEVLYVFAPKIKLYNAFGEEEEVEIYTKFNIIERKNDDFTVVISFHKKNKPIEYLFR